MLRRIGTTICLLLLWWGGFSQVEIPGIHEYIYVDEEAHLLNYEAITRDIGYPPKALKAKIEGVVHARVLVSPEGECIDHKITRPVHPLLDNQVDTHIGNLKFIPAKLEGETVYRWVNVPVRFVVAEFGIRNIGLPDLGEKVNAFFGRFARRGQHFLRLAAESLAEKQYSEANRYLGRVLRLYRGGRNHRQKASMVRLEALKMRLEVHIAQGGWKPIESLVTEILALNRAGVQMEATAANLYLLRGRSRFMQGNRLGGLRDFQWILRHTEADTRQEALSYAGLIYAGLGAYETALNLLSEARELDPGDSRCHLYLAEVLGLIGSEEAGAEALQKTIELGPPHDELTRFQRALSRYNVVSSRD
ncbi:MAG: TonB family protein [Bacteroidota bacterium]